MHKTYLRWLCILSAFSALTALGACADPGAQIGLGCTMDNQCGGSPQTCIAAAPGGYCSQTCTMDGTSSGCPNGTLCSSLTVNGSTTLQCMRVCQNQADCRSGYQCNGTTGGSTKVCKPN